VAAQEPLPPTRAEHLYVRPDRPGGGLCGLHSLPAAVLQAGATTSCPAPQAVVNGMSQGRDYWNWKQVLNHVEWLSTTMEGFREEAHKQRANRT